MLAWGRTVIGSLRAAAGRGAGDVAIVDVETAAGAEIEKVRAG
jgi:hypothetical protein